MRPLSALLSPDSAWPSLRASLARSRRSVEILPTSRARGESVLLALQVTTRSPMGALALETGGLHVDKWLRVLGGGGPRMDGDLASWNGLGERHHHLPAHPGMLFVGHDVIGGFFALDGGALGAGEGEVFYFAPDSLRWEGIDLGYSEWLDAMLGDAIDDFYAENRWTGWEREAAATPPDRGLLIWPGLWTAESRPIEKTSRKAVPMEELWRVQQDFQRQLDEKASKEGRDEAEAEGDVDEEESEDD